MAKGESYTGERFHWERGNQLGEGGQASTWHATKVEDSSTGWVLKILRGDHTKPQARLKREVEALNRLRCNGILKLEDYALGPKPFIVTPYAGTDLSKQTKISGFRPLEESLTILRSLVEAVRCAHEHGVLHRDIKPANVALGDNKVRLIDFGLCTELNGEIGLTTTDEGFGTQAFTAPECSPGSYDRAGPASDIYSLGKLFYWMVTGGRLLHRESFETRHVAQINNTNYWVRNAAAHW